MDWLVSSQYLPVAEDRHSQLCVAFYMGARDLNLGSHAFTASTLTY